MALVCVAAGCSGGGSGSADAAGDGARICVAMPDIAWPAECDVIGCHEQVCDATCEPGSTCQHLDCTDSPQCRMWCQDGSKCPNVDCRGADTCFIECYSQCEASCEGATTCQYQCHDSAQCLLDCGSTPASQCQMIGCMAGTTDCGNGVVVCNRPCP